MSAEKNLVIKIEAEVDDLKQGAREGIAALRKVDAAAKQVGDTIERESKQARDAQVRHAKQGADAQAAAAKRTQAAHREAFGDSTAAAGGFAGALQNIAIKQSALGQVVEVGRAIVGVMQD